MVKQPQRRSSHGELPIEPTQRRTHLLTSGQWTDEQTLQPRKFLIPVKETLETLLAREDTDQNMQITIDDAGPKVPLPLGTDTHASNG